LALSDPSSRELAGSARRSAPRVTKPHLQPACHYRIMDSTDAQMVRAANPPRRTLGGVCSSRLVLVQTPVISATMDQFQTWPEGVQFTLLVQTKGLTRDDDANRWPIIFGWDPQRERREVSGTFDLEIVYPGRPAADISFESAGHGPEEDDGGDPVLRILGGSGSIDDDQLGHFETRFWLTPPPPCGATVRCSWSVGGIDSTVGFDVDALIAAAAESQVLPG
jgi:hypothetical protein